MTSKPENSENSASLAELGDKAAASAANISSAGLGLLLCYRQPNKVVKCSLMSAQGYAAKKTSVSESHQSNPPNLGVAAICSGNRMWWSAYF
jgi:hypothetical protein